MKNSSKWLNILAIGSFFIAIAVTALSMGASGGYHWIATVVLHVGAEICKTIEKTAV